MDKIAIALFLGLLIVICYSFYQISELNEKVDKLEIKVNYLENQNGIMKNNISKLESKIDYLTSEFNTTIVQQKEQIIQLRSDLEKYDAELKNRLQWIKSNSEIGNLSEYNYEKSLLTNCVKYDRINLGCVWYVIHDKLDIHYINETKDRLYNLTEIYNRGGGDCEDLSLVFAASVRYLMNEYNITDFSAWKDGIGEFVIWREGNSYYYMPNAEEVRFNAKYVYVTCYEINATEGHCIVSFCKNKINNTEEISNCVQIEPQEYGKETKIGKVWFYISSDNLCMETKCFTDFEKEIEEILKA